METNSDPNSITSLASRPKFNMCSVFTSLQLASTVALIGIFPRSTSHNNGQYDGLNIITPDIVIIGGGSRGTHAAIKLRD